MKQQITFKSLLVIICLLLSFNLQAQDIPPITVNVATAGTLSTLISSSKKYSISDLTLSGNLNGTDIKYVREMAGYKLTRLNLVDSKIVAGGSYYYDSHYTENNSISSAMFINLSKLTSITIPNSVTSIGSSAFLDCTGLTYVTIPEGVTSIGNFAFNRCAGLTSIVIPNSITSIGSLAFSGCTGLTSITIPSSVTSIGKRAFSYCAGLKEILVSEDNPNYVNIEGGLFNKERTQILAYTNAKSTTIYTIPNSVTSIDEGAFSGCTRLTSIVIHNSITSIGGGAFSGCTGLTSITIPSSVTSIGKSTFESCAGLTSVTIPNSVTTIGDWAFSGCTGLTSIVIPNSVTSIDEGAFSGCTGLTSIVIPNSVTFIGVQTFYYCRGLTSIILGNSVTSIGHYAFEDCTGLKEIYSKNMTPPTGDTSSINKTICKLYVPKGSYSAYWLSAAWGGFTNIIEEATSTSISETKTSNVKVYSEENDIVISGVDLGDNIFVYSESGALLQTIKVTDNAIRITVPVNHTYLIKTTDKTFKVAL